MRARHSPKPTETYPSPLARALNIIFVAVLQIPTALSMRGQVKRLGMFHKASPAVVRWTRYSPAAQEVAGLQVAAIAGVVRDHLGKAPIGVLEIRCDDANRSFARFAHP